MGDFDMDIRRPTLFAAMVILTSTLSAGPACAGWRGPRWVPLPPPPLPHPHVVVPVPVPPVPVVPLPPPIEFAAPPEVVVLPGTDIYVAPDVGEDVYFVDGWWWRPSGGHWYRSRAYDQGWAFYSGVPGFYANVHPGWRNDYHNHVWGGAPWNYERMPSAHVEKNWRGWKASGHWRGAPAPGPVHPHHMPHPPHP